MELEQLEPDLLWRYYQRGYHSLVRSGLYFRQVLRPALSHVYFQRAVPLLVEYAKANRGAGELPPGFGDQMEACPLTPRDLLHLDYAICLGYAETSGPQTSGALLDWPGPGGSNGLFIAADAFGGDDHDPFTDADDDFDPSYMEPPDDDDDESDNGPPFDL